MEINNDIRHQQVSEELHEGEQDMPVEKKALELLVSGDVEDKDDYSEACAMISSLDVRGYRKFLFLFDEIAGRRHQLPESVFRVIMSRGFQLARENNIKETELWSFCCEMENAVQLHGDFRRDNDKDTSSSVDKSFTVLRELYFEYPEQAEAYWKVLSQNGQTINNDLLLNGMADMNWRPDVSPEFKATSVDAMNYLASFFNYEKAFKGSLDFKNSNNFNRTGRWLEFIRQLHAYSDNAQFSEVKIKETLISVLRAVAEKNEGSYLLNSRARQLLSEMESGEYHRNDNNAFAIAPQRFGSFRHDGRLAISDPDDYPEIKSVQLELREHEEHMMPPEEAIKAARASGLQYLEWSPSREDVIKHRGLLSQRAGFFLKKLEVPDITLSRSGKGPSDKEADMQTLFDYEYLQSGPMREQIHQDFGVELSQLTLPEQNYFLKFIKRRGAEEAKPVMEFTKRYGNDGMTTFLSTEFDPSMGERILELGKKMKPEEVQIIFKEFAALTHNAREKSEKLVGELSRVPAGATLSQQEIYECLMVRAKDLLKESFNKMEQGGLDVSEVIAELKKETAFHEVLRVQFMKIAELLTRDNVDLAEYERAQEMVMQSIGGSEQPSEAIYLRALNAMGKLRPMPELYWKVDRQPEEYNQRLGVNVAEVLRGAGQSGQGDGKKTLLEFGPGSGLAKHKLRLSGAADNFTEFAMSDALYYDLAGPIQRLIDFDKIEVALGKELKEQDRQSLVEYVKRTILIKAGQTAAGKIEYNQDVQSDIVRDPNALKKHLKDSGKKMQDAEAVPTSQAIETPDGPIYAQKFEVARQTAVWQDARQLLIREVEKYLRDDFDEQDVYELLNAHPAGVMLGDFSEVNKLRDGQIDVALGVRSTVYVDREKYGKFIVDVVKKLKTGGMYLDDNVRENFGRYYRIAELQGVQQELNELARQGVIPAEPEIYIVQGPGIKGEDYKTTDAPLAVLISNGPLDGGQMSKMLEPGCRLVRLDAVAGNAEYLRSLNAHGGVEQTVIQRSQRAA
ncbi:MAG: hypothetical protein PHY34_00595 [Patescibacteria group bacterium]|nr:hypothetical protein [Patescibacteria group bacterium]MDD5715872.1 hypothetical protein [Patescibacteria group bacterium]